MKYLFAAMFLFQATLYGQTPEFGGWQKVNANGYKLAKELADWKAGVADKWDAIEVKSIEIVDGIANKMLMGHEYPVKVTVDLKGLSCNDIGCELVITESSEDGKDKISGTIEFDGETCEGSVCVFQKVVKPDHPGSFAYSFRLFAKNENLAHRQDFRFVKWIS